MANEANHHGGQWWAVVGSGQHDRLRASREFVCAISTRIARRGRRRRRLAAGSTTSAMACKILDLAGQLRRDGGRVAQLFEDARPRTRRWMHHQDARHAVDCARRLEITDSGPNQPLREAPGPRRLGAAVERGGGALLRQRRHWHRAPASHSPIHQDNVVQGR